MIISYIFDLISLFYLFWGIHLCYAIEIWSLIQLFDYAIINYSNLSYTISKHIYYIIIDLYNWFILLMLAHFMYGR